MNLFISQIDLTQTNFIIKSRLTTHSLSKAALSIKSVRLNKTFIIAPQTCTATFSCYKTDHHLVHIFLIMNKDTSKPLFLFNLIENSKLLKSKVSNCFEAHKQ